MLFFYIIIMMKDNKIKITFILFATLLLLGIVGFTIAYFSDNYTFDNLFSSAVYQTTATETFTSPESWVPGDTTPKEVTVTNTGNIPVKVRVSYTENWESANGKPLSNEVNGESIAIINLDNTDKWTKQGRYYYYNDELDPNEATESFISGVTFNPNVEINLNCVTTTNNGTKTKTCSSNGDDYNNATYTLTLHIETVQADMVDEVWDVDEGTLYGIVKNEYKSNSGYAGLYTGEHKDSYDRDATKEIYYYKNDVTNKNNVIFAGYCWQMMRTTDTGGVKMIYNGVPVDDKCENTRSNTNGIIQGERTTNNMNASYAYGSDFTYDLSAKTFKIDGTIKENVNYVNDKSILGYYTCKNADKNATCTTLYYIQEESTTSTSPYVYPFTINSTNYAQIGTTTYNSEHQTPAYVGYMYNKEYDYNFTAGTTTQSYQSTSNTLLQRTSLNTTYWYADSINYGTSNYELVNPYQVTSTSDYPNLVGKYTFRNTSDTYSNSSVYYIVAVNGINMIYKQFSSGNITTSYYYGDTYDYGETTASRYTITNKTQWSSGIDVTGKYLTYGTNSTSIYYVLGMNSDRIFYENIKGGNKLKYNDTITFGDSISGSGPYTLNNPTTGVTLADYYTNYASFVGKYTCGDSSTTCNLPRYITTTITTVYSYINPLEEILISKTRNGLTLTDTLVVNLDELSKNRANYADYKYTCNTTSNTCTEDTLRMITGFIDTFYIYAPNRYFGSSATWNGTYYTLNNPLGVESATSTSDIKTHHYTCIDPIGTTCTSVGYIYYYSDTGSIYYILLENGVEKVADALDEMLYANNVNTKDSAIKRLVEEWYYNNLLEYDSYLEETIYCNDRSISNLGAWKDDGGLTTSYLYFKEASTTSDLSCSNETDQFSLSNNKAKLKYKVGLASNPEMNLLNNSTARKTGVYYWLGSPYYFDSYNARVRYVDLNGDLYSLDVYHAYGARVVVSLNSGTVPASGSGTMADPYIIEIN